jgi:hypothetical protein
VRARLPPLLATVALAAVVWLSFAPARFLNYDTEYSLLWGADLVHGRMPDLEVPFAPTPHPLATALGALLSLPGLGSHAPYGGFQEGAWEVLAFVALGVLGWLVFALGRAWFGTAAGVLAAVIVLTREPILSYGVRAYVDIPYMSLLLAALLVETRRRRAGTPVLVLLGLAGLLRPEAWLFAVAYCAWLWRGGALRPLHLLLAGGAPAVWALSDLALTGNPLHSLTGTRDNADALGRVTGLHNVPETLPRRLGEIAREPVLFGAAGGAALALWRLRGRATLGAAAGVLALLGFCVLAAAGLSILTRYLLLPATIIALFCAAAVFGWQLLDRSDPWRRRWQGFAVVTVLLLVAFAPAQVRRLDRLQAALATQTRILDDLRRLTPVAASAPCDAITVPNRRAVPQLALWSDRRPQDIDSAQELGRYRGLAFVPATPAIADQFVLDARDADRTLPPPPAAPLAERSRWWLVFRACGSPSSPA